MAPSWRAQVDRFCRQYLQLEPDLDFPDQELLRRSEVQGAIYENAFAENTVRYGPPTRYQAKTLKTLVTRISASIDDWEQHEVSEPLMSALAEVMGSAIPSEADFVQKKSYVTYHLSLLAGAPRITLLENRSLISAAGTTGLRTWEAALHLGQYLCQNPEMVSGKRVLELGAGTGYLSILCAAHLDAEHVIASDGSDDVINNLPESLFLNDLQESPRVAPMDVKWGHALMGTEEDAWNGGRPVDVVLGADVTYDQRVIPALVGTMREIFDLYPRAEMYMSATQRNEETFEAFLRSCNAQGMAVKDLPVEVPRREDQEGPFYNDKVAIRICKIHASTT